MIMTCATCGRDISDTQAGLSQLRAYRAKPACMDCVTAENSRRSIRPRATIVRTAQNFRHLIRTALSLLDDIATSDGSMGMEDIDDLCVAREVLARALGTSWNSETSRYTKE